MTKSRGILPARRMWTEAEDECMRRFYITSITRHRLAG